MLIPATSINMAEPGDRTAGWAQLPSICFCHRVACSRLGCSIKLVPSLQHLCGSSWGWGIGPGKDEHVRSRRPDPHPAGGGTLMGKQGHQGSRVAVPLPARGDLLALRMHSALPGETGCLKLALSWGGSGLTSHCRPGLSMSTAKALNDQCHSPVQVEMDSTTLIQGVPELVVHLAGLTWRQPAPSRHQHHQMLPCWLQ